MSIILTIKEVVDMSNKYGFNLNELDVIEIYKHVLE
jgi:hypothetical protein